MKVSDVVIVNDEAFHPRKTFFSEAMSFYQISVTQLCGEDSDLSRVKVCFVIVKDERRRTITTALNVLQLAPVQCTSTQCIEMRFMAIMHNSRTMQIKDNQCSLEFLAVHCVKKMQYIHYFSEIALQGAVAL